MREVEERGSVDEARDVLLERFSYILILMVWGLLFGGCIHRNWKKNLMKAFKRDVLLERFSHIYWTGSCDGFVVVFDDSLKDFLHRNWKYLS